MGLKSWKPATIITTIFIYRPKRSTTSFSKCLRRFVCLFLTPDSQIRVTARHEALREMEAKKSTWGGDVSKQQARGIIINGGRDPKVHERHQTTGTNKCWQAWEGGLACPGLRLCPALHMPASHSGQPKGGRRWRKEDLPSGKGPQPEAGPSPLLCQHTT